MATTDYLPIREAELVTWIRTFNNGIQSSPTTYGLTVPQATAYGVLADAFIAAYRVANAEPTRTRPSIITKDHAKRQAIAATRQLAWIVQKHPGTTDTMRSTLGLTVPAARTRIGRPADPPRLIVVSRLATTVRIRLRDAASTRRGKPDGVQGARLYSYVGATPPAAIDDWRSEGQITRPVCDVVFPFMTPPGAVVWMTAQWYNPRGETGPACAPVSTNIAGGGMPMAA